MRIRESGPISLVVNAATSLSERCGAPLFREFIQGGCS